MTKKLVLLVETIMVSAIVITTNGCEGFSWNESKKASEVREKGEIQVAILENPLVFEKATKTNAAHGLDYDLLRHFAETYNLKIHFIPKKTMADVTLALEAGQVDVAAARFWIPQQTEGHLAGPALEESYLSLFCRRQSKIDHVSDLANKHVLLAKRDNTDFIDIKLHQFVPSVKIEMKDELSGRQMMNAVNSGKADCAVLENLEGNYYLRAFPALERATAVTDAEPLGWRLRSDREDLNQLLKTWFQRASRDDEIMRIQDHYRSQVTELDRSDVHRFVTSLHSKFPGYAKAFYEAAKEHELDWTLVAAVAYQESHWERSARSHTGVRGLMQLTEDTADRVGIKDRNDPLQSIWGGSFYLRSLIDSMPASMDPKERESLALAAYNSGIAHLRDAQKLAIQKGLNPLSWRHLKTVYPLLENPRIAARLSAGVSRGRETVQFVERVRAFRELFVVLKTASL